MSHVHEGPLATYNSLTDKNLAGYFSNVRMRRHLRKSGLISTRGKIVSENQYRLNMARKEHKKHVKDLLSQAIVHKTLDLERTRQVEIKRKLEEIGKIELVRRVRATRGRRGDEEILPYLSPRTASRSSSGRRRPVSAPNKYQEVIYVDENGRPLTPTSEMGEESHSPSRSKEHQDEIDTRHLYALDSTALRKYALTLSKMEQGEGLVSPYSMNQIPTPPRSARSSKGNNSARARGPRPRTADARMTQRDTPVKRSPTMRNSEPDEESHPPSQLSVVEGALMLHRQEPAVMHQGEVQTLCEITMKYHGPNLTLPRDQYEPKQEVSIDQQHCGGNTLTVFKEGLKAADKFTFISRRHRGYPFSLSVYIDGRMDFRISRCCEYKHFKGVRLGGKLGHFSLLGVEGATPCYRCALNTQATPRSLKRPVPVKQRSNKAEEIREEVIVPKPISKRKDEKTDDDEDKKNLEIHVEGEEATPQRDDDLHKNEDKNNAKDESDAYDDDFEEDEGEKKATNDKYDEDRFESSSSSSSSSEDEAPPQKTKSSTITGYEDEVEEDPPARKSRPKTGLDHKRKIEAFSSDDEETMTKKTPYSQKKDETTGTAETFVITTVTADKPSAGTDAKVFIILNGTNDKSSGKIWLRKGKFHRGRSDIFTESVTDIDSPISDIEIGHDCSGGPKQTWNLQDVYVYCPRTGIQQSFPVYKLLTPEKPSVVVSEQRSMRKNVKEDEYRMRRSSTSSSSSSSSSSSESRHKAKKEIAPSVSVDTRTEMTESTERPPSSASSHSIDVDSQRDTRIIYPTLTPNVGATQQAYSKESAEAAQQRPETPSRRSPPRSPSPSPPRKRSPSPPSPRRRSPSPPSPRRRSPSPPSPRRRSPSPPSPRRRSPSPPSPRRSPSPPKSPERSPTPPRREESPSPVMSNVVRAEAEPVKAQLIVEKRRSSSSSLSSSDSETETESEMQQKEDRKFKEEDQKQAEPVPAVFQYERPFQSSERKQVVQGIQETPRTATSGSSSDSSSDSSESETETETTVSRPAPATVAMATIETPFVTQTAPAVERTPQIESKTSDTETETQTETETETETGRTADTPSVAPVKPPSPKPKDTPRSSSSDSSSDSETETQTETDTDTKHHVPQPPKPPSPEVLQKKSKSSSSSSSGSETETQTETDTEKQGKEPRKSPPPVHEVISEKVKSSTESSGSSSDSETQTETDTERKVPTPPLAPVTVAPSTEKKEERKKSSDETFIITTVTSDKPLAETDANVFIIIKGTNNESSDRIWLKNGKFGRGQRHKFSKKLYGIWSPIKDIEIGHDCSGQKPTWHLQEVQVYCPRTGIQQTFPVYRLLSQNNPSLVVSEQRSVQKIIPSDYDSDSDSGSDSDSDSSSDSESELTEDDKKKLKQDPEKLIPPKTNFALTDSDAPHVVSESDGTKFNVFGSGTDTDNMHGGNDPDSVTDAGPIKSAYLSKIGVKPGQPVEGSILPKFVGETDIELSAIALTTEQVKELGTYIEKSDNVKSLCLRNCGIDDDKFDKMVDSIENTKSDIKMLNLNLNKLGDSAAADIADMMGEKSSIEILLIHGNPLGDKGVKNLLMGILDIDDDDDDDDEDEGVNLRELDLGDTNMGDSGMNKVATFLEKNTTLKTLNLNGNKAVSVEGWQRLGKALKKNKTLQTLSLDFNNIGDDGIAAIVDGLRTNQTLQTLELEDVGITKKGGKMLRDLVKDNPTILEVTIFPGNSIPDDIRDDIKSFLGLSNEAHKKRQQLAS
ncbi:serine-rich adhesin for platelets-like isoform X3 [Pecten maximus]|uniref:serine-rich adhesin for platelets-like isoform X3 n=1 Tax=Pecten maximus TaxID=6579 RepID=UPI0014586CEF|nr:serine-rich adhesin for platelets-like isoform X3 [Pecten maximus]